MCVWAGQDPAMMGTPRLLLETPLRHQTGGGGRAAFLARRKGRFRRWRVWASHKKTAPHLPRPVPSLFFSPASSAVKTTPNVLVVFFLPSPPLARPAPSLFGVDCMPPKKTARDGGRSRAAVRRGGVLFLLFFLFICKVDAKRERRPFAGSRHGRSVTNACQ